MRKRLGQKSRFLSALTAGLLITSTCSGLAVAAVVGETNTESNVSAARYGKTLTDSQYSEFQGDGSRAITIGSNGGETSFHWSSSFGPLQDTSAAPFSVSIEGGTNKFDHQNMKFGSYFSQNGNTSAVNVQFSQSDNTFTQRAIFGGVAGKPTEGSGIVDNQIQAGRSTVTFGDGSETKFHYNWLSFPETKYYGEFGTRAAYNENSLYSGAFFSALGNSETLAVDGSGTPIQEEVGDQSYNVAVSAVTEGCTVTFGGAQNAGSVTNFDVSAYFGGGYDLTTYGHVSTSSDDNDVVYGGTNTISFADSSTTTFNARTFFGAGNSSTTVNFSGNSNTTFGSEAQGTQFWTSGTDEVTEWNQGYTWYHVSEALAKNPDFIGDDNNTYRGNDLPFVFFGGKTLDQTDRESFYYGEGLGDALYTADAVGGTATGAVRIEGNAEVNLNTSAFFGGADERWLAGDQYILQPDGTKTARFTWGGSADQHNSTGVRREGTSAIRQDAGICNFTLAGGDLNVGNVNTYSVLSTTVSATSAHTYNASDNYVRNRFEQVRLIGKNSSFDATGGNLVFNVRRYSQADAVAGSTSTLANNSTLVNGSFFNDLAKNNGFTMNGDQVVIENADGTTRDVNVLMTGLIAFDQVNISSAADVGVSGLFRNHNIDWTSGEQEFFTNTALADTTETPGSTSVSYDANNTSVELGEALASSRDGEAVNVAKTQHEYYAYTLTIEDSDEASDLNRDGSVDSNQARLHIQVKSPDEIFDDGNLGDNKDTVQDVLDDGPDEVGDVIDDILGNAHNDDEANSGFDQLIGAPYASIANDKIRRLTMMNGSLADQLATNDISHQPHRDASGCNVDENGCSCSGIYGDESHSRYGWASFYGDNAKANPRNGYSGYDTEYYGGMFGIDWNDGSEKQVGVYFNYGQSNANWDSPFGGTKMDMNDYTLGVYARWVSLLGGGYSAMVSNVTWSDYETERWLDSSAGIHNMSSDYDSILPTLYFEKGWDFFVGTTIINPYASLQYAYYDADGFREEGLDERGDASNLALNVEDFNYSSLRSKLGMRLSRELFFGENMDRVVNLRLNGAWIHELLGETTPVLTTSHQGYADYPVWQVKGNGTGRDWANIGVGLDFNLTQRIVVLVDYDCFFNESITAHGGMATLRFDF